MASETGSSALRYHEATKHSELSLRMSPHYLDWDNKPSPFKVYIVSPGIPGLDAGIYHFNPLSFALVQLREGDYGPELAAATNGATALSPLTIALTSLAWRNAWKYEARSYRHWFWDGGVIAANLLAICRSESLTTKLVMSFVDQEVDKLLGVEEEKEATVAIAAIGSDS